MARAIIRTKVNTGRKRLFKDVYEAEEHGFHTVGIRRCISGVTKEYKGYKWEYADKTKLDKCYTYDGQFGRYVKNVGV